MEERRRFPRYALNRVRGRLDRRHPFLALMISRSGLLAATAVEPALKLTVEIEVLLDGAFFRSPAQVVFVGEDHQAPPDRRYRIGLEFHDTPAMDAKVLERFLAGRAGEPPEA